MNLRTTVEDITPDKALKWLEGNVHNRPISQTVVDKYTALMSAGRWKLTHQGIAFAEDTVKKEGRQYEILLDGQQRLWAVVNSNRPVKMMVTRGLPIEIQLAVDDHAKRTVTHVAALRRGMGDKTVTSLHAAIARTIWIHGFGYSKVLISNETSVEFIAKYYEGIDFAVTEAFLKRRKRGVTQAGILSVVTQAFYAKEDQERLKEFGKVMLEGVPASEGDYGALALREWTLTHPGTGWWSTKEVYWKTQRVLHSFLQRLPVKKIYEAREQLFPMPESGAHKNTGLKRK